MSTKQRLRLPQYFQNNELLRSRPENPGRLFNLSFLDETMGLENGCYKLLFVDKNVKGEHRLGENEPRFCRWESSTGTIHEFVMDCSKVKLGTKYTHSEFAQPRAPRSKARAGVPAPVGAVVIPQAETNVRAPSFLEDYFEAAKKTVKEYAKLTSLKSIMAKKE